VTGPIGTVLRIPDLENGELMSVQLRKLLDPARAATGLDSPGPGRRLVGAVLTLRGLRGVVEDNAANDVVVIGSNGRRYGASYDLIVGRPDFTYGQFRVHPGSLVTGTESFVLPDGVRVAAVKWTAESGFGATVTWNLRPPR
jgi:hypothetical protein